MDLIIPKNEEGTKGLVFQIPQMVTQLHIVSQCWDKWWVWREYSNWATAATVVPGEPGKKESNGQEEKYCVVW